MATTSEKLTNALAEIETLKSELKTNKEKFENLERNNKDLNTYWQTAKSETESVHTVLDGLADAPPREIIHPRESWNVKKLDAVTRLCGFFAARSYAKSADTGAKIE